MSTLARQGSLRELDSGDVSQWNASVHRGVVELHGPTFEGAPHYSVTIKTFGAHIMSYICRGEERLYMSPNAIIDGSKPIRGGIPIVFPQFSQPNPSMAQHGFARTSTWSVTDLGHEEDYAFAILSLKSNAETMAIWPHAFHLIYNVRLSADSLEVQLEVRNTGPESAGTFQCHALLHTYIKEDISNICIRGFKDYSYLDKVRGGEKCVESRELVTVHEGEVDRIYVVAPDQEPINTLVICESNGSKPRMLVKVECMTHEHDVGHHSVPTDCVLWNAGPSRSISIPDLGEGEYRNYLCIEPGRVTDVMSVKPGASFTLYNSLTPTIPQIPLMRQFS